MKKNLHIFSAVSIAAAFSVAQAQTTITPATPQPAVPQPGSAPIISPAPAGAQAPAAVTQPVPGGGTVPAPTTIIQPTTAVVIPAGTQLLVRTSDNVSSASPPGTRFATTLDHAIPGANGSVALPAGTVIYGTVISSEQARRAVGQSSIDLRLSQISAGAQQIPIQTTGFQDTGARSGRKVARGAAAGAGIGALAGNAGAGAGIGAAAGAVRRGQSVEVPAGSLLQFTLTQPVTIQH